LQLRNDLNVLKGVNEFDRLLTLRPVGKSTRKELCCCSAKNAAPDALSD
jgi:hypothetical protein